MANKRLGPEAKIITLFTALPDDSKRIVMDVLKSQTATRPKASSVAQPAGKRSSRKGGEPSPTASTETDKEGVSGAPKCATCGYVESVPAHQQNHEDYHIFRTSLKKSRTNGEDKAQRATA